ncbi:MAG: hypothetical protein V3U30_03500 [Thermoplasmata archaeon]
MRSAECGLARRETFSSNWRGTHVESGGRPVGEIGKKGFAKVLETAPLPKRLREARTAGLVQIRAAEEGPKPVSAYRLSHRGRRVIEAIRGLRKSLRED